MPSDHPLSFKNVVKTNSVERKVGAVRARQVMMITTKLQIDTTTAGMERSADGKGQNRRYFTYRLDRVPTWCDGVGRYCRVVRICLHLGRPEKHATLLGCSLHPNTQPSLGRVEDK